MISSEGSKFKLFKLSGEQVYMSSTYGYFGTYICGMQR